MEKNPDSINLEWYHHMKCWKTFRDEGKTADNRERRKKVKKIENVSEIVYVDKLNSSELVEEHMSNKSENKDEENCTLMITI